MRVLFSALGFSPGSLFSAIVSLRPDRVVVLSSREALTSLPELELAAREKHATFTLDCDAVTDAFTSFDEGRRWAHVQAARVALADECVVNLAGGTTALQDAMLSVARVTRARTVAVVDRRAGTAQRDAPFVEGEIVDVPAIEDCPVGFGHEGGVFDSLRGLPQVLMASGQSLPSILAMRELGATECVIFHTKEESPRRLQRACAALGFREIASPIEIPGYDAREVERIARRVRGEWMKDQRRVVLNYTAGTKQMAFGLLRGLGNGDDRGPVAGAVYTDRGRTMYAHRGGRDEQRTVTTRLSVAELLAAHAIVEWDPARRGVHRIGEMVFRRGAVPTKTDVAVARAIAADVDGFARRWQAARTGQHARHRDVALDVLAEYGVPTSSPPQNFANGDWLEAFAWGALDAARAALNINDLCWSVKVERIDDRGLPSALTDLDVCFASGNNLFFVSCKTEAVENLSDELLAVATRQGQFGGTFGRGMLLHWHPDGASKIPNVLAIAKVLRIPVGGRACVVSEHAFVDVVRGMIR